MDICGARARLNAFPKTTSTTPAVLGAINSRRHLSVPDTYMGATALVVPMPYNIATVELAKYFVSTAETPEALDTNDFKHVVSIALSIRRQTNAMSVDYLRDCLRSHVDKPDYPAFNPMHIPSIVVSTFRRIEFYHDFGALGRVQEFDNPDNKLTGCCWVLPETGKKDQSYYLRWKKQQWSI